MDASRAAPPDPTRPWTAEIGWSEERSGALFHVTASDGRGEQATIARSDVFDWPPNGPAGVQALSETAAQLEHELLAAGWTSLPAGESWYAKRFAWMPVAGARPARTPVSPRPGNARRAAGTRAAARNAAAPSRAATASKPRATAPGPSRPAPRAAGTASRPSAAPVQNARSAPVVPRVTPWPPDAESLWRCEIHWDAGYVTSHFEAVAYPPGEQRGRTVARSEPLKWLLMALPDPKQPRQLAAARALARDLREAGWEAAGRGGAWYAERYVWRRDGEPPDLDIPPEEPA